MKTKTRLTFVFVLALITIGARAAVNIATPIQDDPTIQKDSIQITAFTVNSFKGNYDNWSWLPQMKFRVNGPIESGSQLYAEFRTPAGPWVKFDCETSTTQKGYWWKTECGGRDIGETRASSTPAPSTSRSRCVTSSPAPIQLFSRAR